MEESPAISADPICLIPSHYFFVEFIPFENDDTDKIAKEEARTFFELQLESLSPLPIDQLLWGYYTPPHSSQSILYACLKSRLANDNYDSLESYTWVLPQFIPQLALETIQPSDLQNQTALKAPDETEDHILHLEKDQHIVITQGTQEANLNEQDNPITLEVKELWSADIRTKAFKDQEQKNRTRLAFINKTFKFSLYFIALIILSEVLLSGANLWLTQYASKIDTQAPTVRRIEDQHTLINKLEQISQNELRPIALLEKANEIRSKISSNIIYDNVDITIENEVTIKGTVGSVNELNRYVSLLNQSKNFQVIDDPKYITRGGKTTFTLKMYFQSDQAPL